MMKFIVDAHLPQRLKTWLIAQGFDTVHTIDLPKANETEDLLIADFSEKEGRIVITKAQKIVIFSNFIFLKVSRLSFFLSQQATLSMRIYPCSLRKTLKQ